MSRPKRNTGSSDPRTASLESKLAESYRCVFGLDQALSEKGREVGRLQRTDSLTGVYSRDYFEQRVEAELDRSGRYGSRLSLLLIGIDGLDEISSHHGCAMGNRVLATVARTIVGGVRSVDLVSRHEVDKFCVAFLETGARGAASAAKRLCATIRALRLPNDAGTDLRITCSIGATEFAVKDRSPDDLIGRAANALLSVRRHGGDGVEVAVKPLLESPLIHLSEGAGELQQKLRETYRSVTIVTNEFGRANNELAARNAELADALDAAVAASEAKSRLVAEVSHDLRTPMNSILGMSDLLLESGLTSEQEGFVRSFRRGGEQLLQLIDGVLELSKLEAGRTELDCIEFSLLQLVETSIEILAFPAHKKGIDLAFEIEPDLPDALIGDPNRLRQILVNLLGNAVKFTERGEVLLTVQNLDSSDDASYIRFKVSDTGTGIPSEKIHDVFESFQQADAGISERFGGTGLGLALSRNLVELMGGELKLVSEEGEGSLIHFDVRFERQTGPSRIDRIAPEGADGMHVLVSHDCTSERAILRRLLESWGCTVSEACDADQTLHALEAPTRATDPFDLVLLDCRMPHKGGTETVAALDGAEVVSRIVLLFNADRRPDDIALCRELGIHGWLEKPVRPSRLASLITQLGTESDEDPRSVPESIGALTGKERHPLHILVVDDCEDNRNLMEAYLRNTTIRTTMASNGTEAMETFRSHPFDLVLMDVQMPGVDGYEATRNIREYERNMGRARTPIVALTACAYPEDKRRSLDAGCDAHLTKPVRKAELREYIEQLASWDPIVIDPPADVADLVKDYLSERRTSLQRLADSVEAGDFDTLVRMGHKMKGTGGAFGFNAISRIGEFIERAGERQDLDAARYGLENLGDYLNRVQLGDPDPGSVE